MADTIHLKRGDTAPPVEATLRYAASGAPVDLTGASVLFVMRQPGADTPKVQRAATIVDAVAGAVRFDWQAADTDTAGAYVAELQVTLPGGAVMTVPNGGYLTVKILEDLD